MTTDDNMTSRRCWLWCKRRKPAVVTTAEPVARPLPPTPPEVSLPPPVIEPDASAEFGWVQLARVSRELTRAKST